ncbi:MAG: glutathione S-transferase family protein, partial [Sphingomicrobium sp.]
MSLRLFYSPGACSIVPHIALHEAGAEFEAVKVMLAEGQHLQPEYFAINPHARVPALGTARGVVTENIAILNFIADEFGAPGSVPRGDAYATAHCNQLLGWFASTVHISFAQVWRANRFTRDEGAHPAIVEGGRENLATQFDEIEQLSGEGWLAGDEFSGADGY